MIYLSLNMESGPPTNFPATAHGFFKKKKYFFYEEIITFYSVYALDKIYLGAYIA